MGSPGLNETASSPQTTSGALYRIWVPAVLGAALSVAAFVVALNAESRRDRAESQKQLTEYLTQFQNRRNGVEAVLFTLRTILHQNPNLSEAFFREVMDSLASRLEVVEAVVWAPRVRQEERAGWEQRVRGLGVAGFEITQGDLLHGAPERAPDRPGGEFYPVLFVEPFQDNQANRGYDMSSVSEVRTMLREIEGSGHVGVSHPVRLDIRGRMVKAVVAATGVYRDVLRPETPEQGRQQLIGYAVAVIVLEDALKAVEERVRDSQLQVVLVETDTLDGKGEEALAASPGLLASGRRPDQVLAEFREGSHPLDAEYRTSMAGREWMFLFRRAPGAVWSVERWWPIGVLCVGLLCTGLVVQHTHDSRSRTLRVEAQVRQRTAELAAANAQLQDEVRGRLKAQEELASERNLLRTLLDRLPDAVHVVDTAGRYLMFNEAHARLLQLDGEREGIGQRVCEVGLPALAAALDAGSAAALKLGTSELGRETQVRLGPDREATLLTSRLPLRSARGDLDGLVVLARDITEVKRAAQAQEQFSRRLQETQKLESLGLLAGGIAHDFNNLLTSILGNVGLARMDLPGLSPVHECLTQVETTAVRAADLCRQMLAYSGKGRLVIRRIDLSALVEETTELLRLSMGKKAVLKLQLARGLPPISGDPTQLRQILMNLVINSSDAIGDRNGLIRVATGTMRVDRGYLAGAAFNTDAEPGDYVYLEVNDDGCGMSPETVAKIFDPFFTTKFTGRGLGLAAVLGIVRGHRGAMKVYSEVGKGASFKLLLPRAEGSAEPASSQAAPAGWKAHGTILLVDDEDAVRLVAARLLEKAGFQVEMAADGREGLSKFEANPDRYRAVLLDLTMPRMDGEEAFREMRQIRPNVRVLLMSGFSHQEANDRFSGKGLGGFIQKPFGPQDLYNALREVIEQASDADDGVIG